MKLKSVTHGHENEKANSGGTTASASVTRLAITKTRTCQPKWLWRVKVFDSSAHRPHQIAPPAIVVSTIAPAARVEAVGIGVDPGVGENDEEDREGDAEGRQPAPLAAPTTGVIACSAPSAWPARRRRSWARPIWRSRSRPLSAIAVLLPPATRSRPTPTPFLVSPALTTIFAGAPSTPSTRSSVAWWAATCGSLRTTLLSRARPIDTGHCLDAPRLADEAVAVDHLEQRQRRG